MKATYNGVANLTLVAAVLSAFLFQAGGLFRWVGVALGLAAGVLSGVNYFKHRWRAMGDEGNDHDGGAEDPQEPSVLASSPGPSDLQVEMKTSMPSVLTERDAEVEWARRFSVYLEPDLDVGDVFRFGYVSQSKEDIEQMEELEHLLAWVAPDLKAVRYKLTWTRSGVLRPARGRPVIRKRSGVA